EQEIRRVGTELHDAFPSVARHPLRALDARAMDMAAGDRELRAALFRFVDVVPACHSLEDLARRLTGFLQELPETPPTLSAAILEGDGIGPLPRTNVCAKVSALTPMLRPDAPALGQRDAAGRMRPLLRLARDRGAHLHIDMESLDSREAVLELVLALLDEEEF